MNLRKTKRKVLSYLLFVEEVKLKATKKDHISFIRKLATQRGFISKVSGYLFPKDIIVSRFHSNVKCDNLHEDVIKKYYDENNGKEDLSSAYFIPYINIGSYIYSVLET